VRLTQESGDSEREHSRRRMGRPRDRPSQYQIPSPPSPATKHTRNTNGRRRWSGAASAVATRISGKLGTGRPRLSAKTARKIKDNPYWWRIWTIGKPAEGLQFKLRIRKVPRASPCAARNAGGAEGAASTLFADYKNSASPPRFIRGLRTWTKFSSPKLSYRARRRFFRRICRILLGFLFGLEIEKVAVPTRRTFHSFPVDVLGSVSIFFQILPDRLIWTIIADISVSCPHIALPGGVPVPTALSMQAIPSD